MKLVNVSDRYVDFLSKYESKIAKNKQEKRPYVGVVYNINGISYFAPLSSPKNKHVKMKNSVDFRRINNGILGGINLNNMIPVVPSAIIEIDIDNVEDEKYKRLLQNQYRYIKQDFAKITESAEKLYSIIHTPDEELSGVNKKIKSRCCDLQLLESVIKNYE